MLLENSYPFYTICFFAGDLKDEEAAEEEALEAKPRGRGRGKKPAVEPAAADEDAQDAGEAPSKRRRKPADDKGN